ncbi:MAG: hypothetical protein LBK29_00065 [Oscillospiraceae bacterium]|nr:hypothetical protein [Oscillospiraceae bacterium]
MWSNYDFTPDTRHQTPDTRHQTPDTRHQTPDTRHQTPDTPIIADFEGKSKYFLRTKNYDGSISDVEISFKIHKFAVEDYWKNDWQERKRKKELSLDELGQVFGGRNILDGLCGRNVSKTELDSLTSRSAEDEALNNLEDEELEKVIDGLSEKQRKRIEMKFLGDLTFKEIAKFESDKVSARAVEYSVQAALQNLTKILSKF